MEARLVRFVLVVLFVREDCATLHHLKQENGNRTGDKEENALR